MVLTASIWCLKVEIVTLHVDLYVNGDGVARVTSIDHLGHRIYAVDNTSMILKYIYIYICLLEGEIDNVQ